MYFWSAYSVPRLMPGSWGPTVMKTKPCSPDAVIIKEWEEGNLIHSETYFISYLLKHCEVGIVLIIQMREQIRDQRHKAPVPKSSPS